MASLRILGVTARRDGSLRVRVRVDRAGTLLLEAFARPRRIRLLARASRRARRAGTLTMTLRPRARARRTLRRRGRLAATVRATFRPSLGQAPSPVTRRVAFRVSRPTARGASRRTPWAGRPR
jgi:hypothetical protein